MTLNDVSRLYAFEDGDTITPRMGVIIDAGYGLQQYFDVVSNKVIETDFTKHPATLFPQAYSSRLAAVIVPEEAGSGWFYNNPEASSALIEFGPDGNALGKFKGLFQKTEVNMNGKKYPALKIIGNLATKDDYTDKYIYYVSSYQGKKFTCAQLIPIQASAGSQYKVELSVEGESGPGDAVLSNDNDWVRYSAYLQQSGVPQQTDVTFEFFKMDGGKWSKVQNVSGMYEITKNSGSAAIKLYNAAVEGVELFKVVATYAGNEYSETFEVTDEHDPFYIVSGCSNFGEAVKVGETVTYNPQVYDRSTNEPATGKYATAKWNFAYTILSGKTGKPAPTLTQNNLTYENIASAGGVTVVIEAVLA